MGSRREAGPGRNYVAEYLAPTRLQADAFITTDADLARQVDGVVPIASIEVLQTR
jgi:hypothetical protein